MQLLPIFAGIQVWLKSSVCFEFQIECKMWKESHFKDEFFSSVLSAGCQNRLIAALPPLLCSTSGISQLNTATAPSEATGLCTEQWGGAAEKEQGCPGSNKTQSTGHSHCSKSIRG